MTGWLFICLGVVITAYLFGSVPTGYWFGKILRQIDIREHGSKSTGATNVLRVLGKLPALATLIIDILKGFTAVWIAQLVFSIPAIQSMTPGSLNSHDVIAWMMALAGVLAILGHGRSIWINFTGGKSAATGLGVLLAISLPVAMGVSTIFIGVLAITRIVSLSSIVSALAAAVLMIILQQAQPFLIMAVAASGYVVFRHWLNLRRVIAGTEPRIGDGGTRPQE
jgi:acyl phosphate:glycerol-3-phosphate acyltransferase